MASKLIAFDSTETDMRAARGSRSRSAEMQYLVGLLSELKPKQVKGITIPEDLNAVKLRTKLTRASQIVGCKLSTVAGKDGVLYFRLKDRTSDS